MVVNDKSIVIVVNYNIIYYAALKWCITMLLQMLK